MTVEKKTVGSGSTANKRGSKRKNEGSSNAGAGSGGGSSTGVGRRRAGGHGAGTSGALGGSGGGDLSRLEKMVPTAYPLDHPYNKDGYRQATLPNTT